MCCVCEPSTLTIYNTYWFPHQWAGAVKAAIEHGQHTGSKQRVVSFGNFKTPQVGWRLRPTAPMIPRRVRR